MLRVVTVVGHGVNLLPHFLNHYKFADEICIAVYKSETSPNIVSEVSEQIKDTQNVRIVTVHEDRAFDWKKVTELYNEVKNTHPDDWWIVADIDEFHIYPVLDPKHLRYQCDRNGWEIVRGGFIDRLGKDGTFPILTSTEGIFKQFPLMGFFRYPMSKACPNKICMMKGHIKLTPGQHYAEIDGHTTWRWQGWSHPLIAPHDKWSVQVHHFKWDSTCAERMMKIIELDQDYAFSDEYRIMYESLKENDFKVNVKNKEFMFEHSPVTDCSYRTYSQWNKLMKKIVSI